MSEPAEGPRPHPVGEPSQTVKLKFTRMAGKTKKKYKVVLKRNVRASLEPTVRPPTRLTFIFS